MILFKTSVGLGLLLTQHTFVKTGLYLSMVILALVMLVNFYTSYLLCYITDEFEKMEKYR